MQAIYDLTIEELEDYFLKKDEKIYKHIVNKLYEILLAECNFKKLKKAV